MLFPDKKYTGKVIEVANIGNSYLIPTQKFLK